VHKNKANQVVVKFFLLILLKQYLVVVIIFHKDFLLQLNVLVVHKQNQLNKIIQNVLMNKYLLNHLMHVENVLNLKNNHLIVYKLNQDEDEHHFDVQIDYQYRELVDTHVLH
jgi:hypothetical protein